jgi:hypothetical protein
MPWTAAQSKVTGYKYCVPPGGSLVSPGDIVLGTYGDPNQCQAAITAQSTSPPSGMMPLIGQPSGNASVNQRSLFSTIPSTYTPIVAATPAEAKTAVQSGVVNCQLLVDDITAFVQGNIAQTLAECSKGPAACEAYIRNNSSGLIAAGGAACSAALNAVISQLTSQYASASGIASAAGTGMNPAPAFIPPTGTPAFIPPFGTQPTPYIGTPPQQFMPNGVTQQATPNGCVLAVYLNEYTGSIPGLSLTPSGNAPASWALWTNNETPPVPTWGSTLKVQPSDWPGTISTGRPPAQPYGTYPSIAAALAAADPILVNQYNVRCNPTVTPPVATPVTTPTQPITTSPPPPPPTTTPPTTTPPTVTPPPPPIPSVPVFSVLPMAVVCNDPIPPTDFLSWVSNVTGQLVNLGAAIIDGSILDDEFSQAFAKAVMADPSAPAPFVTNLIKSVYTPDTLKPIMDCWSKIVSLYPYAIQDWLIPLLALKNVLTAIVEMNLEAGNARDVKVSGSFSVGLEVFKFGGAVGTTIGGDYANSLSANVKYAVLPLIETIDIVINNVKQTKFPNIEEAIELYLGGSINDYAVMELIKLNGGIWDQYKLLLQVRRTRPDVLQSVSLYLRKSITLEQLVERLHGLGVTNDDDISAILELSKFIPGPGDIVRFMVRNVEDPAIVGTFGLDDEFQAKYQGLTKGWAESQGLDDETMGRFWRAHWVIPSPGQLYTMLQRLRPDNVPAGVNPNEWITTPENVYLALSENDILPFWRDRLIAISYSPLGKIDARRAFQFGSIDFNGLISAYRDQGYDEEKATIVALNTQYQIRKTYQSNKWVSVYVKGGINATELNAYLMADGASQDIANATLAYADNVVKANLRETCIKALHNGYMTSGLSQQEATTALIALGQEASQATTTVSHWACELASTSKVLAAGSLCGYFQDGLISQDDFMRRLTNLGYSSNDAAVIVLDCLGKIIVKRQHSAQQLAAKIAAANKQNAALLSKANKQLEQAARAEEKLRASEGRKARAVSKALLDAAMAYAGKTQTDLDIVGQKMDAAVQNLVANHGATYGDAVQAVTETAAKWSKGLPEDLTILSEQGYAASLSFDAIGEAEATNG